MKKKLCIILLLLLLSALHIFAFSEMTHKNLIFGTWSDNKNNVVMYFLDNNKYEIRVIRKYNGRGDGVIAPLIMTGRYQFLAHALYTGVYHPQKKVRIVTKYNFLRFHKEIMILKNRKTGKFFALKRELAPTSQPRLRISRKIKKLLPGVWKRKTRRGVTYYTFRRNGILIKTRNISKTRKFIRYFKYRTYANLIFLRPIRSKFEKYLVVTGFYWGKGNLMTFIYRKREGDYLTKVR